MARSKSAAKRKQVEEQVAEQPAPTTTEAAAPAATEKARGRQKAVIPPGKKVWSIAELEELGYKTTSAKVRFLHSEEWPRGAIAEHLGIRYQHVRNVLITPVEKPLDQRQKEAEAADKAE